MNRPLNKYLAQSGVCSRRKATELIRAGCVKINGQVVTDPGYKVQPDDRVKIGQKVITLQKKVYLLLNKPADCITAHTDQRGRKTVMDLIDGATKERLHAVGRLDKNTTGLLLITSDGDLTQRLAHPKYQIQKTYVAILDKPLQTTDLMKIKKGVRLRDGTVQIDHVARIGSRKIKVVLHSGKYRVIRRVFKVLSYNVISLDRIKYAQLTKKGLKLGQWRFLTQKEIAQLKS